MRFRNPLAVARHRRLLRELEPPLRRVEQYLAGIPAQAGSGDRPILFFNASTRIHRLSLNGAFSLLASWRLRADGHFVRYLVCQAGLDPCVLGADPASPERPPPCRPCLDLSRLLFPDSQMIALGGDPAASERSRKELDGLPLEGLIGWNHRGAALGQLVLPSVRWILRRHRLEDTPATRTIFRRFLVSAATLAEMLTRRLPEINPRALVVFNGVFYPEAVARSIARTMDIPVITHEVGLRPLSAFFSHDEATFRRVELPDGARLTGPQQKEVEQVLASRIRGDFSMAGVRFWPRMDGLPKSVRDQGARHKRTVSVFTNVIFDTSQIHANVAFADMFEWLDALADVMEKATDTLFVIRAHPDETRPGKVSQESVRAWYESSRVRARPNVVFIGPGEFTSSYELIRASKLVLVYNSSVGLEAAALGVPVLAAARARYSHLPVAVLPATREAYGRQLEAMLASPEIVGPSGASETARAFLYWELFRASLDLSEFLSPHPQFAGMVTFQEFAPDRLQHSMALTCVANGILQGAPFVLPAGEDGVAMQAGVGI